MAINSDDVRPMESRDAALERNIIQAEITAGATPGDAAFTATLKLAEIESRSGYIHRLHGTSEHLHPRR